MSDPSRKGAQSSPRNRELAKIHIGAKALGIDDEAYRTMLFTLTGKRSAGDLDGAGRRKVIESLKADGAFDDNDSFAVAWRGIRARIPEFTERVDGDVHRALYLSAWQWLGENDHLTSPFWESAGLTSFVARVTGNGHLNFCTPGDVNKLVEAVKAMVARHAAEEKAKAE